MNYIDEIFARADIQCIRGFLQCGADCPVDKDPYKARLDRAGKEMTSQLHKLLPEREEYETAMTHICDHQGVVENVFMEIGPQVGAMLTAQAYENRK